MKFRGTSGKFERCPPISRSSMVRLHEFGGPHKRSPFEASPVPFCQVCKRDAFPFQGSAWSGFTNSKGLISVCSKLCATLPRKIDAVPFRPHGHASRVQLLSLLLHQCHTTACSTWHRSDNAIREVSVLADATIKLWCPGSHDGINATPSLSGTNNQTFSTTVTETAMTTTITVSSTIASKC